MGGKKKGSSSSSGGGDGDLVRVDPMPIFFTFSRIRPQFSCGRFVLDTLQEVLDGTLAAADLPSIAVLTDGEHMYSLNNRRLFVFKELAKAGKLTDIPVRLKPVPQTKRMAEKYTPAKCALAATLKGVAKKGAAAEGDAGSDDDDAADGEEKDVEQDDDGAAAAPARSRPPPSADRPSAAKNTAAAAAPPSRRDLSDSPPAARQKGRRKGRRRRQGDSDDSS